MTVPSHAKRGVPAAVCAETTSQGLSPRVGLVVVNFGSHHLLKRNLGSGPHDGTMLIVVVDSFSSEAARVAVRQLAASRSWELVETETNVGFGLGCNLGAEHAL